MPAPGAARMFLFGPVAVFRLLLLLLVCRHPVERACEEPEQGIAGGLSGRWEGPQDIHVSFYCFLSWQWGSALLQRGTPLSLQD